MSYKCENYKVKGKSQGGHFLSGRYKGVLGKISDCTPQITCKRKMDQDFLLCSSLFGNMIYSVGE